MQPPSLFARHLPPSAGPPRVLALDADAAARLAREAPDAVAIGPARVRCAPSALPFAPQTFDAAVAEGPPSGLALPSLLRLLRPGGRCIALIPAVSRADWLGGLARAGFIHLFAEDAGQAQALVRGECPPQAARTVDRIAAVAGASDPGLHPFDAQSADPAALGRYLHLLIAQTPNKPAWWLAPGERLEWRAAVGAGEGGSPAAPAFTSLVRAVGFMQAAILAGTLHGVNKVGKFPAATAREWPFALIVNPSFEAWQASPWAAAWRWEAVDPRPAVQEE